MSICHKKLLILTTFLLGVPLIYEYHMFPLTGFLAAFLFSWLIWEDFETKLVDMRVVFAFTILVIILRATWMATLTGVLFILLFQCFFYGFAKFEPKTDRMIEDDCPLQSGCITGFIPLLGLSAWLYWTIDMVFNPIDLLLQSSTQGIVIANHIIRVHMTCRDVSQFLEQNLWIFLIIIGAAALLLVALKKRVCKKEKANLQAVYPMGDGDPYIIGALAALCGAESFFYVVLMGSMLLGEVLRAIYAIRSKRGIADE